MHYDPIKNIFNSIIRKHPLLRKLFYKVLGVMFLREWYVKRTLRPLLSDHNKQLRVYDAGCGFGQYSYFLLTHFPHVTVYSVDIKEDYIRDCNEFFLRSRFQNRCTFTVEDLTSITHNNAFHLILSVDVMEHIPDDRTVFQNFYRALKPGGLLLVNTPSDKGGSDAHSEGEESFIGEHARTGYGVDEIQTKLTSAGFKIQSLSYTYGSWGMWAWRLGIKTPMRLLNTSKIFFTVIPFYYLFVFPFMLFGMFMDIRLPKSTGAGLIVVAQKPHQ